MPETRKGLLDSYAMLALLQDEPGASAVADLLRDGIERDVPLILNEINVGEVYYIVAKHRSFDDAERVLRHLETLPLEIVSNTYAHVLEAARLKAQYTISYADAFAVATALRLDAAVVTGDRAFAAVEDLVKIHWI